MARDISNSFSESCIRTQNLARKLQDSCKIADLKVVYKKCQYDLVLLIKNSNNSRFNWFSVSFSYQKYTNKFARIQKLARLLQDFESLLIFFIEFGFVICLKNTNLLRRLFENNCTLFIFFALIDIL